MHKFFEKVFMLFHTLWHMKPIQVFYQLAYRAKKPFIRLKGYKKFINHSIHPIQHSFPALIPATNRYLGANFFKFLNQEKHFIGEVDWNYLQFGKLWNYNLQYFDYINDETFLVDERVALLKDFSKQLIAGKIKPEPYPVSLRLINTLIFLSKYPQDDRYINKAVLFQIDYLKHNLEFNILANHLLENYISLLAAGFALKNEKLISFAIENLKKQVEEQILEDGCHYECSPMYHSIVLSRFLLLLDISNAENDHQTQLEWLKPYVIKMLGWLDAFQWNDGSLALVNDAANGIAPSTQTIFLIAKALKLEWKPSFLNISGYRRFNLTEIEVLVDAGNVMPSYQPGHTHSDMLQVCLCYNQNPIIVDTGTATYQISRQRIAERKTAAHNTVVVNEKNQFQVWSSFRVGKRALCTIEKESNNLIIAHHNGYKSRFGVTHRRRVQLDEEGLHVFDILLHKSKKNVKQAYAVFHFEYNLRPVVINDKLLQIDKNLFMSIQGATSIVLETYNQAIKFNSWKEATKVLVFFSEELYTKVHKG
jgi:hypothetical protein